MYIYIQASTVHEAVPFTNRYLHIYMSTYIYIYTYYIYVYIHTGINGTWSSAVWNPTVCG